MEFVVAVVRTLFSGLNLYYLSLSLLLPSLFSLTLTVCHTPTCSFFHNTPTFLVLMHFCAYSCTCVTHAHTAATQ